MRREADESGEAQQSGRQLNSEFAAWAARVAVVSGPGVRRRRCPKLAETGGPIIADRISPGGRCGGAKFSFGKT